MKFNRDVTEILNCLPRPPSWESAVKCLSQGHNPDALTTRPRCRQIYCMVMIIMLNRLTQQLLFFPAHQKSVTGCVFSHKTKVLVCCGEDRYITWHWTENGQRLGGYLASSSLTSLQYPLIDDKCL